MKNQFFAQVTIVWDGKRHHFPSMPEAIHWVKWKALGRWLLQDVFEFIQTVEGK